MTVFRGARHFWSNEVFGFGASFYQFLRYRPPGGAKWLRKFRHPTTRTKNFEKTSKVSGTLKIFTPVEKENKIENFYFQN